MLIYIIFIIIVILFGKNIYDINKFTKEPDIIKVNKLNNYINKKIFNPFITNYDINFILMNFIDNNKYNYYITDNKAIRLLDFYMFNNIYIHNNSKLYNDINININDISNKFFDTFSCNIHYGMSIFKNNINTEIVKNKNNHKMILLLSGILYINLYNPIHENKININNKIKYNIKVTLSDKENLLYIPTNWSYDIESTEMSSFITISSDTLFTYHYNLFR
uniref:Cupin-like domain-containing protein n=1 Tax=viral metagenome TaxID=1070528 RepID=A0A6C0CYM5_9ZZZZ